MNKVLLPLGLIAALLSGCLPTSVIDDVLIIEGEGYDYIGHNQAIGTVTMPNFVQSGNDGSQGAGMPTTASMIHSLSGKIYIGQSMADHFQSEGQKALRAAKLRITLFNERMARRGLKQIISFRNRDPDTPQDLSIAVVEGSCQKLLTSTHYQTQIPVARYVQDMILQNTEQSYPFANLSTFLNAYYGHCMDPFMPIIRKRGDHLEMHGLALFRHDKYVMRLPARNCFVFKMLYEPFNQGIYDYEYVPGRHIVLRNVCTKMAYFVKNGHTSTPDIHANVSVTAQIRQAYPDAVNSHNLNTVNQNLARHLEHQAEKMVQILQKKRVDPLRLGDYVRSFTYGFNEHAWPQRYPHAKFHCRVRVTITQIGLTP
ncbi:MAG: Ger(x)C family spore germination protein [Sporolactobacillus sp.]